MSKTLAWQYLSPVHVNRAITAQDEATVRTILEEADEDSKTGYFTGMTPEQKSIILDFFYHLFRFAKAQNMTSEKISTLISLAYHIHNDAMRLKATMHEAYRIFESYIISHAVHRPPYSSAIFAVDDVKHINDYLLTTYYRHYKLYFYAFTCRNEATVRSFLLGDVNEIPSVPPPLSKSVPYAQWEAAQLETQRKEEERLKKLEEEQEMLRKEEQDRNKSENDLSGPPMSAGLRKQLDVIKGSVEKTNQTKMEELEGKVLALENKLAEMNKPPSAGAKPAARPPGKK